ncbi:dCMP deaminase family protein [Candidatus Woesearchaeota archaeon]|nr:dCMP deaminase family protein [Candidatus Woesearchaeota archaeon]MBW3005181.1 dCMP deaminase family protein [Candidatus Woesearchaeota archaeon]
MPESKHRPSWDEYFMVLAKVAATRSTCLSRPTGAVIVLNKQVLATGYNGSMPGMPNCSDEGKCFRRNLNVPDHEKNDYARNVHAEANAIARAARKGIPIKDATLYVTLFPCYTCLKLLVAAGIKELIYELDYETLNKERDNHWREEAEKAGLIIRKLELADATKKIVTEYVNSITSARNLESE